MQPIMIDKTQIDELGRILFTKQILNVTQWKPDDYVTMEYTGGDSERADARHHASSRIMPADDMEGDSDYTRTVQIEPVASVGRCAITGWMLKLSGWKAGDTRAFAYEDGALTLTYAAPACCDFCGVEQARFIVLTNGRVLCESCIQNIVSFMGDRTMLANQSYTMLFKAITHVIDRLQMLCLGRPVAPSDTTLELPKIQNPDPDLLEGLARLRTVPANDSIGSIVLYLQGVQQQAEDMYINTGAAVYDISRFLPPVA